LNVSIIDGDTQKGNSLFELFWGALEVVMSILILEETLSIKSLSNDK